MAGRAGRRGFGTIARQRSGRYQASYIGQDGKRHTAPSTFDTKDDAVVWLNAERARVASEDWQSPKSRAAARAAARVTVAEYADTWLAQRDLKPRTRQHYRNLLDRLILPTFGAIRVDKITPPMVRDWHARLDADRPTQRAHAYALFKAICKTAVDDDLLAANPCRVRGAGQAKRASKTKVATVDELATIVAELPERYRAMALLASWCAMRFGELIELRRSDIDLRNGIVHVRRAATWVDGVAVVGTPKSDAGIRDVHMPEHVRAAVREHLRRMPVTGRDALLFPAASDPAGHMRPATLSKVFYRAREAAGRPDLRWHDLRHTGAVMATLSGASLREVMGRLGHSTATAAMRYQSIAEGRDAEIAAALDKLASGSK